MFERALHRAPRLLPFCGTGRCRNPGCLSLAAAGRNPYPASGAGPGVDVPLSAERTILDGEQKLTLWVEGQPHVVDPPLRPYCYARTPFDRGPIDQQPAVVRPLSSLREEEWFRAAFRNVRELARYAHRRPEDEIAEAHIPFVHRILLDEPDFFRAWPNGPPRVLTFDIEQLTTGKGFPTGEDPIISIAWAFGEEDPACVLGDGEDDRDVLEAFLAALERYDPDILAGYNVAGYDLPRVLDRLSHHGLDPTPLHREGGRIDEARWGSGKRLVGRVLYDVYGSVRADQTLAGIKDRKLATVAQWRGIDVVDEDASDTRSLVGTERLARYNESDVRATRAIGQPYLDNLIELASFYGAPFQTVAEATANFHATTLQGRIMVQQGVISDGRNDQRYPELYEQTGGEGFVGGIVEIYQRGLFRPITHVDFASMYPSILVALGAGADNTRYHGTLQPGPYEARREGERLELLIPDPARKTRHRVTIQGRSELAIQLGELLDHRLELKQVMKDAGDEHARQRASSQQGMIKVILNSVYGVMASRHARYASLPVAMAIVGTARHLIREVEDALGEAKVETDTDGVYADGLVDPRPIEARVNRFVEEALGGEPVLRVDADVYQAGWFHEGKNYLLLHEDGRLEAHGVAFKGSSRAPLFDKALDRVARALLNGRKDVDEVASQALDLSAYEPDDFIMRVRLGKQPGDYAAENHVAPQVARAAQRKGREVSKGDQIPYIKTSDGYDVPTAQAFQRLDEAYYLELLSKLLGRLGIEARPADQMSLAEFL